MTLCNLMMGEELFFSTSFRPTIYAKHSNFLVIYVQNVGCVSGDSNLFSC